MSFLRSERLFVRLAVGSIVAAVALSGCASTPGWLAASGPTRAKVSSGESNIQASIQGFTVSDAVAKRVIEAGNHGGFYATFGVKVPNWLIVGAGHGLQGSVWQAAPPNLVRTL